MKNKLNKVLFITFVASSGLAGAASINVTPVSGMNGNSLSILEATGNSLTLAAATTLVSGQHALGFGGVWNMENAFSVSNNETITLNLGGSPSQDVIFTYTSAGQTISNQTFDPNVATSGTFVLASSAVNHTFTVSSATKLTYIGIFTTDRNDAVRIPNLSVTYLSGATATTSGANADNNYFHNLSGTEVDPIVSFSLLATNHVRWDDLSFVAVPEPSTTLLSGLGVLALLRRRR